MAVQSVPATNLQIDLRDLASRLWRRRFHIVAVCAVAGLLGLGAAFLMPKWYKATAVILPPDESDVFSNMSLAQRALTKFPAFGVLGDYFTPADVFKAVLKSRTIQESVIDKFGLSKVYETKSHEATLRELKSNYDVKLSPDGTISVSVEDRDPKRAAAMAMAFLEGLDHYNIATRNTRARRTRLFLEHRVHETDSLLHVSEQTLRTYQETHHAVVPTVASGDVQSAADLMARKITLEVRLGVLKSYLKEDNDEIVQTRTELESLKQRIRTLPGMQSVLARMIRDAKVQEQLYLLLTAELEQARIRETMDTPTVQVLDAAEPPERHSRPRRLRVGVMSAVLAFFGATAFFGFWENRPLAAPE